MGKMIAIAALFGLGLIGLTDESSADTTYWASAAAACVPAQTDTAAGDFTNVNGAIQTNSDTPVTLYCAVQSLWGNDNANPTTQSYLRFTFKDGEAGRSNVTASLIALRLSDGTEQTVGHPLVGTSSTVQTCSQLVEFSGGGTGGGSGAYDFNNFYYYVKVVLTPMTYFTSTFNATLYGVSLGDNVIGVGSGSSSCPQN